MKIFFVVILMTVLGAFGHANENDIVLSISLLPSDHNYSSCNIPVRLFLLNNSKSTVTFFKPVISRTLQITILDKKRNVIAISPQKITDKNKPQHSDKIILYPNEIWGINSINIPDFVSPGLPVGQELTVVIKCILGEHMETLEATLQLKTSAPNSKITDQMISHDQALSIAKDEIIQSFKTIDFLNKSEPIVNFQNGIYTVTYPKITKEKTRGDDFILQVNINARSGKVISLLGSK